MKAVHAALSLVPLAALAGWLAAKRASRRRRPAVGPRVIFLDIDGVLNRTVQAAQVVVAPELVARLKRVCDASGAQIVLSTFWRAFDDYIAYVLSRHDLDGRLVVGMTPGRSKSTPVNRSSAAHLLHAEAFDAANDRLFANRADEIRAFLAAHPRVEKYAILDDRADAADRELLAHFVRTEPSVGLTDADVAKAIALLT